MGFLSASKLRRIRWFFRIFSGFTAAILLVIGLVAIDRSNDPRVGGTLLSQSERSGCFTVRLPAAFEPDQVEPTVCFQYSQPQVGDNVEVRVSDTTGEVMPAEEHLSVLVFVALIDAVLLAVGVIALITIRRRPEIVLKMHWMPGGGGG